MTSETERDLRARAERFIADDVDPESAGRARATSSRVPTCRKTDLADRFAGSLEFGTAGLRGVIGAGPNRMNRAVVLRTTHGLAQGAPARAKDARAPWRRHRVRRSPHEP